MANCFGEPISNKYLRKQHVQYAMARTIRQPARAQEAYSERTRQAIDQEARNYVHHLKADYGYGESTLCLVYNATGDTLRYVAARDYYGYIGRTPYPVEIHNGQWAAFHHVHSTGQAAGSEAAVVYRGKNSQGQERDFLIAWSTPWSFIYKNKAYCAIGSVDFFQGRWGGVYDALNNAYYHYSVKTDGCQIFVDTVSGSSPIFKAILTLDVVET